MPDLKAAAKELREIVDGSWSGRESRDACILAVQALEALAWQHERKAAVHPAWWGDSDWLCVTSDGYEYYADTPLGAILAAMEGERDA